MILVWRCPEIVLLLSGMSDEQKPPPALRLKPRLRPAEPEGSAVDSTPATPPPDPLEGAAPQSATEATSPPAAAPKIRLKPRLEADAAPAFVPDSAGEPGNSVIETPAAENAAPPPVAEGAPRIRLKARINSDPSAPTQPIAEPAIAESPMAGAVPPPVASRPPMVAPSAVKAPGSMPPIPAVAKPADSPSGSAPPVEGAKFKLKPKTASPAGSVSPAAVPVAAVSAAPGAPPAVPTAGVPKAPPPFPVVAQPKDGTTAPPIPHVSVAGEVPDQSPPVAARVPRKHRWALELSLFGVAGLIIVAGLIFVWKTFVSPSPEPPPIAVQPPKPPASAPVAAAAQPASPTPSDTLNALAKAPVNAINRAQAVVATRDAAVRSDAEAVTAIENIPAQPAPGAPSAVAVAGAGAGASQTATAMTSLSPGVTATMEIATAEAASPAFRSFAANARVGGVFQGNPPRAFINGRTVRAGDTVDSGLGIVFDGIDAEKKILIFKDRSGAVVVRKY